MTDHDQQAERTVGHNPPSLLALPRAYLFAVVLSVALAVLLGGFLLNRDYQGQLRYWQERLTRAANANVHLVNNWLSEHRKDAELLASTPSIRAALANPASAKKPTNAILHFAALRAFLDQAALTYGYLAVYILNPDGAIVASSSRSPALPQKLVEASRSVTKAKALTIIDSDTGVRSLQLALIAPVHDTEPLRSSRPDSRSSIGELVILIKPEVLSSLLPNDAFGQQSSETVFLFRLGNDARIISQVRHPPSGQEALKPGSLAIKAVLEKQEAFGDFNDYRGVRVLGVTRFIPELGWALVAKIDRQEALAGFRQTAILSISIFILSLFVMLGATGLLWRSRQIHDLWAEMARRETAEETARQASLYARNLLEASLDPLVTISREGKITDVNQATELVTGVRRERLVGSDFSDYFTDSGKARQGYERVFAEGSVRDYPLAIRDASGRVTDVLYNATVFRNAAGEVQGIFAAARDITERKLLEEQLWQAQKLEAVGSLAGGVAHDFNNILGVILGYAELALENLPSEDPLAKHITGIRKSAERAAALTRQLLAFGRKQIMQPKVLDLNEVVAELTKMLTRLIGENIELILKPAADLDTVKADPVQIEQVLMNLAVNARDAMPKGGKLVIATSNAELDGAYNRHHSQVTPGSYVMLSISDTGLGMDEETTSRIFEPFFTTKGLGKGTGLGLSIVYGIVKQSGGYIWVYSELSKGTTFKIYLPRVTEKAEAKALEVHPVPVTGHISETILLVEDEPLLAEVARTVLESSGYTVLQAARADDALQVAASYQGQIQLLLTDVILRAGIDGTVLAERLRATRPDLQVIFMSGYSDVLVAAESNVDAGSVLLEKPFTALALRNKVREMLDRPPRGIPAPRQLSSSA